VRKTLLVLHHSHTDVGYTELQSRIERRHADFLRQAVSIAERDARFRWVAETFWGVECFLARTDDAGRAAFEDAVRRGAIGLSASYANFSELIDHELLARMTARAAEYGAALGVPIDSAMTADVNGNGWAFATALADAGVANLFTCVHTHHGRYPLERPMQSFWWETVDGRRLLVTSGEHYHFGNELGIVPGAVASYLTKDECDAKMIFHDPWAVAAIRIPRFLLRMEDEGWPFDFVPVMASGLRTDNGPPNAKILDFMTRWNEAYGDEVTVEMASLSEYFARVRAADPDLPTHRGDWPDWWSDGPASRPEGTRLWRQARRDLARYERTAIAFPEVPAVDTEDVARDLALYAEHTFSHSDSVTAPWHPLVAGIATAKTGFAARAAQRASDLVDGAAVALGGVVLEPDMPLSWRVVNPTAHEITDLVRLHIAGFEYHELGFDRGGEVDGRPATLGPGETRDLVLAPADVPEPEESDARIIETEHLRVDLDGCVSSIFAAGRELLRDDRVHDAFVPVHEVTPAGGRDRVGAVRGEMGLNRKGEHVERKMGLNRKGEHVERTAGALAKVSPVAIGPVLSRATLAYDLPGVRFFEVEIAVRHDAPRMDVAVRLHKESAWDPENLYLSLPFAGDVLLDRAGVGVRPRVDQIPGTLTDYYSVDAGFLAGDTAVATIDSHLVQLGPLAFGERLLAGDPRLADDPALPYAWLMNNFWETNFDADLGGFHEFRFAVIAGADLATLRTAVDGLLCFRLRRES